MKHPTPIYFQSLKKALQCECASMCLLLRLSLHSTSTAFDRAAARAGERGRKLSNIFPKANDLLPPPPPPPPPPHKIGPGSLSLSRSSPLRARCSLPFSLAAAAATAQRDLPKRARRAAAPPGRRSSSAELCTTVLAAAAASSEGSDRRKELRNGAKLAAIQVGQRRRRRRRRRRWQRRRGGGWGLSLARSLARLHTCSTASISAARARAQNAGFRRLDVFPAPILVNMQRSRKSKTCRTAR